MYERGQRGRRIARALIVLAILYGLAVLFLWIAQPGYMGPTFDDPPSHWYGMAWIPGGLSAYFAGLGWMLRIYRADPESGERTWRYRDRSRDTRLGRAQE